MSAQQVDSNDGRAQLGKPDLERGEPSHILRATLLLGRPRTCLIGVVTFALGMAYGDDRWTWPAIGGAVVSFLIPFLGNIHNSTSDLSEDQLNLPGRVEIVREVGLGRLRRIAIGVGVAAAIIAVGTGLVGLCVVAVCLLGTWAYSKPPIRAKARPYFGLVVFSQIVGLPFLYGAFIPSGRWTWSSRAHMGTSIANVALMFGFVSLNFLAKGMVKNVPDYSGDRQAGVRTSASIFPTHRGAAIAAFVSTLIGYLLLLVVAAIGSAPTRIAFASLWIVVAGANGTSMIRHDDRLSLNRMLKRDMMITFAFFATLLLLARPDSASYVLVASGVAVIALSDILGLDSRRVQDVRGR